MPEYVQLCFSKVDTFAIPNVQMSTCVQNLTLKEIAIITDPEGVDIEQGCNRSSPS